MGTSSSIAGSALNAVDLPVRILILCAPCVDRLLGVLSLVEL